VPAHQEVLELAAVYVPVTLVQPARPSLKLDTHRNTLGLSSKIRCSAQRRAAVPTPAPRSSGTTQIVWR